MRPHDTPARHRGSADRAARSLLASGLGWLRGWPLRAAAESVDWQRCPEPASPYEPEVLRVDRQTIRKAAHTQRKLFREFPRALPRLVGDKHAWFEHTTHRLELVKAIVHQGRTLPEVDDLLAGRELTAARATIAAARSTRQLVTAAAWLHGGPEGTPSVLRFVHERATDLAAIARSPAGLLLCVRLAELVADLPTPSIARLVDRLCDPCLDTVAVSAPALGTDGNELMRALAERRAPRWPENPPQLGAAIRDAVERLLRASTRQQRNTLRVFDLLVPPDLLADWSEYHARVDELRQQAKRLLPCRTQQQKRARAPAVRSLFRRFERVERSRPPRWDPATTMAWIGDATTTAMFEHKRGKWLVSALQQLPHTTRHERPRIRFFEHWHQITRKFGAGHARQAAAMTCDYLADKDPATALGPWRRVARLDSRAIATGSLAALYELLEGIHAADHEPLAEHVELGARLVAITGDAKRSLRGLQSFVDSRQTELARHLDDHALAVTMVLSEKAPEQTIRIARRLLQLRVDDNHAPALRNLVRHHTLREPIARALHSSDLSSLLDLAELQRLYEALTGRPATTNLKPASRKRVPKRWIDRFPRELHASLRALIRIDDDAERSAERILGSTFRDATDIDREITGLRSRLEEAPGHVRTSIRSRLASLEARRDQRQTVTPSRLRKLQSKVDRRVERLQLDQAVCRLRDSVRPAVAKRLRSEPPPELLSERRHVSALRAILALEPAFVGLATELLRARCGEPPWDFRDHPNNARFLRSMRSRGIDVAPWLDGHEAEREHPERGRIHLSLEDDPLEVLQMGAHFDTCLAPDDCNFFSTIANAIDINKRVMFARTTRGKVVGRCLFALTSAGDLLTFHAYSHLPGRVFRDWTADFARSLAERMQSALVPRGQVKSLVAPSWYDDGPRDLTGRFDFLQPMFDKSLDEHTAESFREELLAQLAPHGLDELTLPVVLDYCAAQLFRYPKLTTAILDVARDVRLPRDSLLVALTLATRAEAEDVMRDTADRLLQSTGGGRALDPWDIENLADSLIRLRQPERALALLRRTRPKGVRRFLDETDSDRLALAARAHDRLRRPKLALQLYRLARSRNELDEEWQEFCQKREEALALLLGGGNA